MEITPFRCPLFNTPQVNLQLHCTHLLKNQSYVTTDGQSASLSWCQAPIWDLRPDFFLPDSFWCVHVGRPPSERTYRKHRLHNLFYCYVTSQRTRKLRALHSNGCCFQSHLLATGLYATISKYPTDVLTPEVL
jgi:hypothetical protein